MNLCGSSCPFDGGIIFLRMEVLSGGVILNVRSGGVIFRVFPGGSSCPFDGGVIFLSMDVLF